MPDESDKPELRPAATNPWYVLMTVAGEQTASTISQVDGRLHARNRQLWNGWQSQALSDEQRRKLVDHGHLTKEDLELSQSDQGEIDQALRERCPNAQPPHRGSYPDFSLTKFSSILYGRNFLFPRHVSFGRATFLKGASLVNSIFFDDADFADSSFFKSLLFNNAVFYRSVLFEGARFNIADFQGSVFYGGAVFTQSRFMGNTYFSGSKFDRSVLFEDAVFEGRVAFKGTLFCGAAIFEGNTFRKSSSFDDATFKSETSFGPRSTASGSAVHFLSEPPTFFGASLHEDTDFNDVVWPPTPSDPDEKFRRNRATRHRRAYERLKLLMDGQKKVGDELMFQRQELRCREAEATDNWRCSEWWVAIASRLFGLLSEYGWDPVRPLRFVGWLILAGWWLIFAAEWWDYHLGVWPDPTRPAEYLGFWQSAALSFSNVFGLLGLNRTFLAEEIETLTTLSEIVSTAQTILGLLLLFLLGLALRNRFRIK